MVKPTKRDTAMVRYITLEKICNEAIARAGLEIGITSPTPVPD